MTHAEELPAEEYAGPATLRSEAGTVRVEVSLAGHFEPIDGRFHWHGRITADPAVDDMFSAGDQVVVDTGEHAAQGRLSDLDPWGRFRVTGTGTPPF